MPKIVYHRNIMSSVNQRMYDYVMSLSMKASKNGDNDTALKLRKEAQEHLDRANHHALIGRVCGNEYV